MEFTIPFFGFFITTSIIELLAVLTGLMSVWYARKENILVYPVGIVSVLIYVYLCYHAGLYADMGINAFYFIMSIYGWYAWTHKGTRWEDRPISHASRPENLISIGSAGICFIIIYYFLKSFTNSTVPAWDAFTTALFISGMWMMALKKIENWILWIIGDILCIPLFAYKGLYFSGFQYLVFTLLAIMGWLEWKKRIRQARQIA